MSQRNPATRTPPTIAFILYKGKYSSDGGIRSLDHILDGFHPNECILINLGDRQKCNDWRSRGFTVHELGHWRLVEGLFKKICAWIRTARAISRIIRSENVRTVHLNDIQAIEQSLPILPRNSVPSLFVIRDVKEPGSRYSFKWKLAVHCVDYVVALSSEMADHLAERLPIVLDHAEGVNKDRVTRMNRREGIQHRFPTPATFIYSAVPQLVSNMPATAQGDSHPMGTPCILYVGAVRQKKAQLKLLTAIGDVLTSHANAHICFLGDFRPEVDDYAWLCWNAAQKLRRPDRVNFLGHAEEPWSWYSSASVVALASEHEGLPRSIIEALASGTPVATFDVTSAHEVVSANNAGIVVPKGAYASLAEAIESLLCDEESRAIMGENGKGAAARLFSPEKVQADYRNLYDSLVWSGGWARHGEFGR